MVSTKSINGILKVIEKLMLDTKSISELSKISLIETEYALKVLVSNGYVLKSKSNGVYEGKKYRYVYYVASESAREILNNGGFVKQLSMKEKGTPSVVNKVSIKDSKVEGQINQGSNLDATHNNITNYNNSNPVESKNDSKSIWEQIWKFTDHKLIAQIILIIISLILGYFGIKYLK
jgi:hypothetical protein